MKIDVALQLLIQLMTQAQTLGNAIRNARDEGRDDLTEAEVDAFKADDDRAKATLDSLIEQRQQG